MRKVLPAKVEDGRVLVGDWASEKRNGASGVFIAVGPTGATLRIIASEGTPEAEGWDHVSVSTAHRCPNWPEMCWIKDAFFWPDECVVQFHVPESEYVNNHPYTLHLWRHVSQQFPRPPSILVGVKADGTYRNAAEAQAGYERAKAKGLLK